jgi:hypothetical protein
VLASHEAESIPALARVHSSLLAAVRSAGVQAAAAPSDVSSSRPPAGSGGAASAGAHARAMLTGEPSALLMALGANPLVALPEAVTSAGYAAGSRRLVLRGETSPWQVAPVTAAQGTRAVNSDVRRVAVPNGRQHSVGHPTHLHLSFPCPAVARTWRLAQRSPTGRATS